MATNTIAENPNAKDYNKYDFSGYELTENGKGGYDWTDSSGNKNSLYEDDNGINHSITGANGASSNYTYNGTKYNDYISKLNKAAKKAYKTQSKTPITSQNLKTPTTTSGAQVIIMTDENGQPRKVGTSTDPNVENILTGKAIANSYEAIANANVGDWWVDKDGNIHVVTEQDITYCKKLISGNDDKKHSEEGSEPENNQSRTTTPEESTGKDSDERIGEEVKSTRDLLHDPNNFLSNYQAIIRNDDDRELAEELLSDSEGKSKGIYGILPAFLFGEYGNYHSPKYENKKRYYLKDTISGEIISDENGGYSKDQLKKLNKELEKERKELNLKTVKTEDGKYTVNDNNGPLGWFDNFEDAEKFRTGKGLYELSNVIGNEQHYVTYDGKKMRYDSASEALDALKELKNSTRGERAKAWAQFLYHTLSSLSANDRNLASDIAGEGRPYKSSWQTEIENRQKGNNELYYKNEEAKNDTVRKLMQLADAGMIDLNNLTNEQMATFIGAIGKEKASQIINTLKKQELDKFMAMEYWNSWTDDQRNALSAWFAQSGQGPQTDSMIALASGKVKAKDFANKWNTQTRMALAEQGLDIQRLEKIVEDAALKNKMTQAQADVIKELVGEQLRSAKLGNNAKMAEIATSSVDSLSKIIDAVVPF